MIISDEFKKKMYDLWIRERYTEGKKLLIEYRMKNYHLLENLDDKINIDYKLAYHEYKENNIEFANKYLDSLKDIFSDKCTRFSWEYLYYKYKWLCVNVNFELLSLDFIIEEMKEIYDYFMEIKEEEVALMALENIFRFQGNEENILNSLEELLKRNYISDKNFVNSILKDCEVISNNLYIRALTVVERYNYLFNIDVV